MAAAAMHEAKPDLGVVALTEEAKREASDSNEEELESEEYGTIPVKYRGTAIDHKEMSMLGKKQVLRVCVFPSDISISSPSTLGASVADL